MKTGRCPTGRSLARAVLGSVTCAGFAAFAVASSASCSRFGPVYPARPNPADSPPIADPEPARVVAHLAITADALRSALDDAAPRTGDGTFPLLGSDRRYSWERGPFDVGFSQGRVVIQTKVQARIELPLRSVEVPLDLRIEAEPVISAEYAVRLQSVEVHVASPDTRLSVADRIGGVYSKIEEPVAARLKEFAYDLRPLLSEAYARVARPIPIPLGDATGCARLRVIDIEAGPTVLAGGIEKDVALVVAPSITLPCADALGDTPGRSASDASTPGTPDAPASAPVLPPLSNVASLTPGPFTVTIPIAARYDELTRAMSGAFTDGKLFFSAEYPQLYLEKPELYESDAQLVLRMHLHGPVHKMGIDAELDGDLYLVGHPAVVDNELSIPDLEPTIETRSFLLSLKAMTDSDRIRDEARRALRLDIGARLRDVRDKLGPELTFGEGDKGCFEAAVDRVEVTGVHPHAAYLRVYVAVTAHARAMAPCPKGHGTGG